MSNTTVGLTDHTKGALVLNLAYLGCFVLCAAGVDGLTSLREAFKGNVIEEGQGQAYEHGLIVWATSPARKLGRPAVILQPRGEL